MNRIKKLDKIWFYIIVAYTFSFALRLLWIHWMEGNPQAVWNGQVMINTNDGYYFASIVKHMLSGAFPENQVIPVGLQTYPGMVYSIYFAAKILPFSLDTIILYAPAVVASLIVIPVILIMRLFNLSFIGFLAALLASVTWSFYHRTMAGYFDTDMYAIVFPFFILYFYIRFLVEKELWSTIFASALTALYIVFYPQGYAASGAIFLTFLFYGFVFFNPKDKYWQSIPLLAVSLLKIPILLKLTLILIIWFAIKRTNIKKTYYYYIIAAISLLAIFIFSDFLSLILSKVLQEVWMI